MKCRRCGAPQPEHHDDSFKAVPPSNRRGVLRDLEPAAWRGKSRRLPYSLKILLENLLRFEDGSNVTRTDIEALLNWNPKAPPSYEISFTPARSSCRTSPACRDRRSGAMREAMTRLGGNADESIRCTAELVIDHPVQVDSYGSAHSLADNNRIEFERNGERYAFLRWVSRRFAISKWCRQYRIVHQVNLEYLGGWCSRTSWSQAPGLPDTLVARLAHHDDHGLGVLGWASRIERKPPCSATVTMLIPQSWFQADRQPEPGRPRPTGADVTSSCASTAWSTNSLNSSGWAGELPLAIAPPSQHVAEFGSTCAIFRSMRKPFATCASRAAGRVAPAGRGLRRAQACGVSMGRSR